SCARHGDHHELHSFPTRRSSDLYQEARELRPEELRRVVDVNFLGAVNCYWAALPKLVETQGTFAHVSSALAYRGIPLQAAYCSRSEEHTSEPSHLVISYAVFCLE